MVDSAFAAVACVLLAITGLCLLIVSAIRTSDQRVFAISLLVAGILFAAFNVIVFVAVVSVDAFTLFEPFYIIPIALAPMLAIAFAMVAAHRSTSQHRLSLTGFVLWSGCVGFAHLFAIAAVSAGV
ncbi:MAG: hypothetical protein AAF525_04385 [Pseudomonadota bacterium]